MMKNIFIFIMIIGHWGAYAHSSDQQLDSDISNTHKGLLKIQKFEDRVSLVGQLVQKYSDVRQQLFAKERRSNDDMTAIFQITTLKEFYDELKEQTNSNRCIQHLRSMAYRLYPSRSEDQQEMFPFEQSIYNLYGKMCSLNFQI